MGIFQSSGLFVISVFLHKVFNCRVAEESFHVVNCMCDAGTSLLLSVLTLKWEVNKQLVFVVLIHLYWAQMVITVNRTENISL